MKWEIEVITVEQHKKDDWGYLETVRGKKSGIKKAQKLVENPEIHEVVLSGFDNDDERFFLAYYGKNGYQQIVEE